MTRDRYKTVTSKESFAVLIPSSAEAAMGEATFQMEFGRSKPVRAVTFQELKETAAQMKGVAGQRFFALLALRGAMEAGDQLSLTNALKRLELTYRSRESEHQGTSPIDKELGELLATRIGLSPDESRKHLEGLRPGPKASKDPFRLFSYEISESVGFTNAQIVLWWMHGSFRPAIYCDDVETALYIHTFFIAPTGGTGFRICPHCTDQFFQDRPNQDYCRPEHREAHRVARWRNKKKEKELATKLGKKERKNVPKKTR